MDVLVLQVTGCITNFNHMVAAEKQRNNINRWVCADLTLDERTGQRNPSL